MRTLFYIKNYDIGVNEKKNYGHRDIIKAEEK